VTTHHERDSTEHSLLDNVVSFGQGGSDALGKLLIVGHL
jgi:hypothetical protein